MTTTMSATPVAAPKAGVAMPALGDADLMAAIRELTENTKEQVSVASVPELSKGTTAPDAAKDGEKMFSDVFWKPESVPDFPVRIWNREDWDPAVRAHIPESNENWAWDKDVLEQFAFAMYCEDRTLLYGPTGTGKSATPREYCAKLNIPFMLTSCHGQQESTDFLGKDNIKFDETTQSLAAHIELSNLATAAKHGGMIVLDEAFRSPILMAIQSLLEPGGSLVLPDAAGLDVEKRRIVPPKGKHWLVLTDNTNGQGSEDGKYNAEVQDLSTLDRITASIFVGYPKAATERKILRKVADKLTKENINLVTKLNRQVRAAFAKGTLQQPLSLRAGIAIAKKAQYLGIEAAYKISYVNKLSNQDMGQFGEIWRQVTATALTTSNTSADKDEE